MRNATPDIFRVPGIDMYAAAIAENLLTIVNDRSVSRSICMD